MFILKQYDTPLIKFEMLNDQIDGQSCRIEYIYNENSKVLPIGLKLTNDGLMSWLRTRVIPKNRAFVDEFLAKNGLSHQDIEGIIKICMGLSLNDAYWVVDEGFSGQYSEYNLYEHDFEKALSLIAYTGYGSSKARGFSSSPEFTTAGMLRKGWRRLSGKVLLYKGGTSGGANTGNEPYSEFMASQIAEKMGLHHVTYGLSMWKKSLCSTCELFTDIDHAYVPIYRFVEKPTLRSVGEFLNDLGKDYADAFSDMLVFDALICNEDRHFGNFGLMVDNHTNRPVGFAPLFDHGLSLFNYWMPEGEPLEAYVKTRKSFSGASFEAIAEAFMTEKQKKQLRKMIGFHFSKHPSYHLPAKRMQAIEKVLQDRVSWLLNL